MLAHGSTAPGYCEEEKCTWWVDDGYTTENIRVPGCCAIKFLAVKNSDGHYVV